MKIEWEEIYSNSSLAQSSYYEATYRAKVKDGWLIRHETCCNFQYACKNECEDKPLHGHVDEEGHQDIRNSITFLPDSEHRWGEDIMANVV